MSACFPYNKIHSDFRQRIRGDISLRLFHTHTHTHTRARARALYGVSIGQGSAFSRTHTTHGRQYHTLHYRHTAGESRSEVMVLNTWMRFILI
jgi:hypothetical protein